jgi:hypothetical protein
MLLLEDSISKELNLSSNSSHPRTPRPTSTGQEEQPELERKELASLSTPRRPMSWFRRSKILLELSLRGLEFHSQKTLSRPLPETFLETLQTLMRKYFPSSRTLPRFSSISSMEMPRRHFKLLLHTAQVTTSINSFLNPS